MPDRRDDGHQRYGHGHRTATKQGGSGPVGTGQVFKVNPVQSSGDESLTDQKDSATAVSQSEYATMQLRNLDGSRFLSGTWVNVRANTGPAAYSTSSLFIFGRGGDRFEPVMG